jgi:hypothetical protein
MKLERKVKETNANYRLAETIAKQTEKDDKMVEKYHIFIKDVYELAKKGRLKASDVARKHKLSPNASVVLQKIGVLKAEGSNRKDLKWIWLVGEPDVNLTEKLVEGVKLYDRSKRERSKFQKIEEKRTDNKVAIKELIKPDCDKYELKLKVAKMFARLYQFQPAYEILITMVDDRD